MTAMLAGLGPPVSPFVAAVTYVSPRARELTDAENRIRNIAYSLKGGCPKPEGGHTYLPGALEAAARVMAPLVPWAATGRAVLVPIPGSSGCTRGNRELALAIARILNRKRGVMVRVADVLTRSSAVESLHSRRHRGLAAPRSARAHRMVLVPGAQLPDATDGPLVLIDNVVTTGSTFAAGREALGGGYGVAYAQADEVLSPGGKGPARPSRERRAPR